MFKSVIMINNMKYNIGIKISVNEYNKLKTH